MADWLDKTFFSFDRAIFARMHALHNAAGGFFDRICKYVSFLGKSGWFFIVLAFVFLLFLRTRKEGLGMAIALVFGALVTNILLKNIVNRTRPFNHTDEFFSWWQAAGSNMEDSSSFPSGHTTAAFAAMVAFFLLGDKRYSWTGLVFAFFMGFSRIYLIVHYPTDVLVGFIVGTAAGIGGALLSKLIYKKAGGKFKTLLYECDAITVCRTLFKKKEPVPAEQTSEEQSTDEQSEE